MVIHLIGKIVLILLIIVLAVVFIVNICIIIMMKKEKIYDTLIVKPHDFNSIPNINLNLINDLENKLYNQGFILENSYKMTTKQLDVNSYSKIFIHKEFCTLAKILYSYSYKIQQIENEEIKTQVQKYTFELITRFHDGSYLVSRIEPEKSFFDYDDFDNNNIVLTYKDMADFDDLLHNHFNKINELIHSKSLDNTILSKDYPNIMNEENKRILDKMADLKILKYKPDENHYEYTWSGVFKFLISYYKNLLSKKDKNNAFGYQTKQTITSKKVPAPLAALDYFFIFSFIMMLILSKKPARTQAQTIFRFSVLIISIIGKIITSILIVNYKKKQEN